jgi:hypothetical protein
MTFAARLGARPEGIEPRPSDSSVTPGVLNRQSRTEARHFGEAAEELLLVRSLLCPLNHHDVRALLHPFEDDHAAVGGDVEVVDDDVAAEIG